MIIIGINKTISTSKIKKIIVIRKNRSEKGNRDELLGSKPHSKGDDFSRSTIVFFDNIEAIIIVIIEIHKIIIDIVIKDNIIYINLFNPYDWKSYILYILYKFIYLINK